MTTNFFGSTLRTIREWRGFTQTELSEHSKLSQGALSKFENGVQVPSRDSLASLAKVLRVSPNTFGNDLEQAVCTALFHRRRSTTSATALRRARSSATVVYNLVQRLGESLEIETPRSVPIVDLDDVPDAGLAAQLVREAWGLGDSPVSSVTALLESAGVVVVPQDIPDRKMSGYSLWLGAPDLPVVVYNSNHNAWRIRHTLLHELGHLSLHVTQRHSWLDRDQESDADKFAGEFLVPSQFFDLATARGVSVRVAAAIQREWGVSFYSVVNRSKLEGKITSTDATALYRKLNAAGLGAREPDSPRQRQLEQPTLFRKLVESVKSELGYSDRDFEKAFWMSSASALSDFCESGSSYRVIRGGRFGSR